MIAWRQGPALAKATLLSATCSLMIAGSATASAPLVSVDRGLNPTFNRAITDYTTTCRSGRIRVTVAAPRGTAISVDHAAAKRGKQTVSVPLRSGQRIVLAIRANRSTAGYSIRCLPNDFPRFTASGRLPSQSPLMGIAKAGPEDNSKYAIVTNAYGVPIWWKVGGTIIRDVKSVGSGRVGYWDGTRRGMTVGAFSVFLADGRREAKASPSNAVTDHHETLKTARGTWFTESYVRRSHVDLRPVGGRADSEQFDALIREYSPSGRSLWAWNSRNHIASSETGRWWPLQLDKPLPVIYDPIHINSISEDGHGGLIVSFRNLDAVYRIIKSTGRIDWKLGGTTTSKSLAVIGDPGVSNHLGGQHDARVLPDGTISILDNSTATGRNQRVTRWAINRTAHTATLVEKLVDAEVGISSCCGSARRFSDGSWLVAWGGRPFVRAYGADHRLRFALRFSGETYTYRANPISKGQATRAQLVAGMDMMHPR